MSYRPLTFFTALSITAHAALFGVATGVDERPPELRQESSIEIGLVSLPKINKDFTTDHNQPQIRQQTETRKARQAATVPVLSARPESSAPRRAVPVPDKPDVPAPQEVEFQVAEESRPVEAAATIDQAGISPTSASEAAPIASLNQAPTYPDRALRYGWEGEVWLKIGVDPYGEVNDISIAQSSGYKILDRAALKTVRTWQFEPARIGDETTEGSVLVPIRFRIKRI